MSVLTCEPYSLQIANTHSKKVFSFKANLFAKEVVFVSM